MLKRISLAMVVLCLLPSLISCFGPINAGYLRVNPDVDITRKKFQYPLRIVFGKKVQDKFSMPGSVRNINVEDFHKTLTDILVPTLENNYREVTVGTVEQNKGLELLLNRIELYQVQEPDGLRLGVRLNAEILKEGIPKGQINGQDVSDFKAIQWYQMDQLMESALQKMIRGFYNQYMLLVTQQQL